MHFRSRLGFRLGLGLVLGLWLRCESALAPVLLLFIVQARTQGRLYSRRADRKTSSTNLRILLGKTKMNFFLLQDLKIWFRRKSVFSIIIINVVLICNLKAR